MNVLRVATLILSSPASPEVNPPTPLLSRGWLPNRLPPQGSLEFLDAKCGFMDVTFGQTLDVVRLHNCHLNTARKVGDELRLAICRTASGNQLYTPDQAAAIGREIERRRRESYR